ncbi:hypothetical protein GCM10025787_24410 [Saccharopolyspora rosea]
MVDGSFVISQLELAYLRGCSEASSWCDPHLQDFDLLLSRVAARCLRERPALQVGCVVLAAGAAVSLVVTSLALLVAGAVVAGLGQGASFRAGLTAVGAASPAERRSAVSSSFFVVVHVAISVPVIGVGAAEQVVGLVPAGVGFAIGALALIAFASLLGRRRA